MQRRDRSPKRVGGKERVVGTELLPTDEQLAIRRERFAGFYGRPASPVAEDSGYDRPSRSKRASSAGQGHDRSKARNRSSRSKREPSSHPGYDRAAAERDEIRHQNEVNAAFAQGAYLHNYGHGRPAQQNTRVRSRPVSQRPPRASATSDAPDVADLTARLVHHDPQPHLAVIISVV